MSFEPRYIAPPCPQCGLPDGARLGKSEWGHLEACCSDACGLAFRNSEQRCLLEIERAEDRRAAAQHQINDWQRQLAKARKDPKTWTCKNHYWSGPVTQSCPGCAAGAREAYRG